MLFALACWPPKFGICDLCIRNVGIRGKAAAPIKHLGTRLYDLAIRFSSINKQLVWDVSIFHFGEFRCYFEVYLSVQITLAHGHRQKVCGHISMHPNAPIDPKWH